MLNPNDFEFRYVAHKFNQTFGGRNPALNSIEAVIAQVKGGGVINNQGTIRSIMKIYNSNAHIKVKNELKRLLSKYAHLNKKPLDLISHLFHGTRANPPETIYQGEQGFDFRFAAAGAHGKGLYFADNAHYSRTYQYAGPAGNQMFMCLVLTGVSS